jgi:hypothetical protein
MLLQSIPLQKESQNNNLWEEVGPCWKNAEQIK